MKDPGREGPERALSRALAPALAILAAATAVDLLGVLTDTPALWTAGAHLVPAGIVAGIVGGVAGARILGGSVRSGEVRRRRALGYASLGLLALTFFSLARWVRGHATIPPDPAVLLAEPVSLALLWLAARVGRERRLLDDGGRP